MNHIARGGLILVLALPVTGFPHDGQDTPASPSEQFKALVKHYRR